MLGDLYPLIAALSIAATVYILRELHRKRTQVNPQMPDLAMRETLELWTGDRQEAIPAGLEKDLLAAEAKFRESANPRLALRFAILESATAALHLEAIAGYGEEERQALLSGYVTGMDGLLRDAVRTTTLKWTVLRYYGRLKYDDAAPHDWFQHFIEVAQPYIREKVRLARDFVFEMDHAAGQFVARYDALLEELQQSMLKAPPKKRFVPPDLPARTRRQ